MGFFYLGLKKEFETAVINEPTVFEPISSTVLGQYSKGEYAAHLSTWVIKMLDMT